MEIGVIIESAGFLKTFVASKRPPSPVSIRLTSALDRENASNAAAVVISKKVIGLFALAVSHSFKRLIKISSSSCVPSTKIRSVNFTKCGDV